MSSMRVVAGVVAVGAVAGLAGAAPVINGTISAGDLYGPALAVQTTQTQFGDNESEWNAAYGSLAGGRLNLGLTGNIEANFNRLEVFIDSRAGGQAVYSGAGNDNSNALNGLTFDSGFTADYHVIVRRGNSGGNRFDVDISNLQAGTFSSYTNLFAGALTGIGATGTGVNASPIIVAYDNSNVAGVTGGAGPANQAAALAVTTGLEFSIALADLANTSGPVRVLAFQNAQNHDFASNQFLPGLVTPQGNVGGDGAGTFTGHLGGVNLNNLYPGAAEGWFEVVPAPGAAAVLGLGAMMMRRRVRR
jgi:hypothetical protein